MSFRQAYNIISNNSYLIMEEAYYLNWFIEIEVGRKNMQFLSEVCYSVTSHLNVILKCGNLFLFFIF